MTFSAINILCTVKEHKQTTMILSIIFLATCPVPRIRHLQQHLKQSPRTHGNPTQCDQSTRWPSKMWPTRSQDTEEVFLPHQ